MPVLPDSNSIKTSIDVNDRLRKIDIACFNMIQQEYLKEVGAAEDARIDTIITKPPTAPSRTYVRSDTPLNLIVMR